MKQEFAGVYGAYEEWHWWFQGRQRILEEVLKVQMNGARVASVASLGCGPIEGMRWIADFTAPGGYVVGVDAEPMHLQGAQTVVTGVVGSIEALPLRSASFDVVLALDVLEHLDEDVQGLKEAARIVKPGGLLLVTVPALPSLWGGQDIVSEHRRRYTRRTLKSLFARAQIENPRITYFNTLLFPPIALVRWARRFVPDPQTPQSDFAGSSPGRLNDLLKGIFSMERHLVGRIPLPIGVSLMATARMAAG
ncbi:MAG: class I SAM-dependent methyltransferase [Acidobacteria bacterium]|nr:class I SAM-dependent methyltransferase [Acidobacteriota bacterium]